ncbi:hypothetical protein SAMN05421833_15121 [Microbispora rosea]|uniref:Uncharacterized protein n=1 Tax=Microbispora rosea TaxID=58117 RepID=A0A1N7HHU1_9ACTN|nr:protein DpdH [Microbispora rosea]GIH51961.1 hypothetical protein Mro03_71400 [Microbispora rosea subsp. rosea]SIS24429.1 hypothetical protein SAMN05421833_15121 [Microbispora rosea]
MPELRGYLCWDPEVASRTIKTEAVNPSPAIFLATHAPLRIRQARIQGRSLSPVPDKWTDEMAVLNDFLKRRSSTGTLLMPVVGDSGSGKSHLVRWVREKIADNATSTGKYKVIYLEKSQTSLKAVIEALLEGLEDESLEKLRSEVRSFSSGTTEEKLARRLINALNETLAATTPNDLPGAATRVLAGPRGLASILQDPYIQEHMLAPGRYVPQLASQLLRDRGASSAERPPGFTVEDLPLSLQDVKQAAQISQRLLQMLLTRPELQHAAVDLLNQSLESAVRSASNLGVGRLLQAMLQVRQGYAEKKKEIILLIEDFALIQGVQGELLEALTESATREGTTRYAPMRTLMAVTTGYFRDLPETVMSRVAAATSGYVYDLDRVFNNEDDGTEQIASFVGRYLNAARVGDTELDRLQGQLVPNHCDECPLRTECHQAFGHSEEGYGLYPFNRPALTRMIHSVAPRDQPWAFVPRTVLSTVLRPILIEHTDELRSDTFPGERFKDRYRTAAIDDPLPTSIASAVDSTMPEQADRLKRVLEFWGNGPHSGHINTDLLTAFGLKRLPDGVQPPNPIVPPIIEPGPRDETLKASLRKRLATVEDWGARADRPLPQDIARELRGVINDAIIRRYPWTTPLMKELAKTEVERAWPNNATIVSIDGASERIVGVEKAPIKFARNPFNSQSFQSWVRAMAGAPITRVSDVRRLATLSEAKTHEVTSRLQTYFEISDEQLVLGFRASLIGAALAGIAWPGIDEASLLAACLHDGSGWGRQDQYLRTQKWQRMLTGHMAHRTALVERLRISVGVAQGTGAVRMIDAARVLPLLKQATDNWTWNPDPTVPAWVKPAVNNFSGWIDVADEQIHEMAGVLQRLRHHVPRGVSGTDSLGAVMQALKEAEKVGLSPSRLDKTNLENLYTKAVDLDWRIVSRLEDDLEKSVRGDDPNAIETRVRAAARDRGAAIEHAHNFLIAADKWLDTALSDAAARSGTSGDDNIAAELKGLLRQWASLSATKEGDLGD